MLVFKKILLAFLISVAIVLGLVIVQPSTYTVTRSATIAAPPPVVFAAINDFHNWQGWSPWAKLDPGMKQTYSGPPAGVGAEYRWSGNASAGEGSMTIIESAPNERVGIQLAFTRTYASSSVISFGIQPGGAGSVVTWNMTGQNNFALKALSLFSSMDKMVGPDFERGLAQLKSGAEAAAQK
jgi:Polyketide cyclase / dehydrase and lipid transport